MEEGPQPPNLIDQQLSFLPGVVVDWAPSGAILLCACPPVCRLCRFRSTSCDGSEPLTACMAASMASAMQGYWSRHAGVTCLCVPLLKAWGWRWLSVPLLAPFRTQHQ